MFRSTKVGRTLFGTLFLLLVAREVWGAYSGPITWDQYRKAKYFQLGIAAGTPAGVNLCAGYWFDAQMDYLMTQFCAMHYGSTLHGLEIDVGKSFYRDKNFRAFYAVSIRNSHIDLAGTRVDFFGLGPYFGFNWKSIAVEAGVCFGVGRNTKFFPYAKEPNAGSRAAAQLNLQLGLKGLFWQ